jgi:2-dehydro-3-deoxygluconokinase
MYWRAESAARRLVQHAEFERTAGELPAFDLVFLSGISLAILPAKDREVLIARLRRLAMSGTAIAFDTNFRPVLWRGARSARISMEAVLPSLALMLTSFEDERRLWGDDSPDATITRLHDAGVKVVVLKLGAGGALYSNRDRVERIAAAPTSPVVDTTAAGDSFNAGFIASWLTGNDPGACCRAGAMLSGVVIGHRGAIIPADSTPALSKLLGRETAMESSP